MEKLQIHLPFTATLICFYCFNLLSKNPTKGYPSLYWEQNIRIGFQVLFGHNTSGKIVQDMRLGSIKKDWDGLT